MRRSLVSLGLILAAACAPDVVIAPLDSGVEGTVMLGPTCPVERAGEDCEDQPFAAKLLIVDATGATVAATTSAADGSFRVGVAPGSYRIEDGEQNVMPFLKPVDVVVRPNGYTRVRLSFDSGIR